MSSLDCRENGVDRETYTEVRSQERICFVADVFGSACEFGSVPWRLPPKEAGHADSVTQTRQVMSGPSGQDLVPRPFPAISTN